MDVRESSYEPHQISDLNQFAIFCEWIGTVANLDVKILVIILDDMKDDLMDEVVGLDHRRENSSHCRRCCQWHKWVLIIVGNEGIG